MKFFKMFVELLDTLDLHSYFMSLDYKTLSDLNVRVEHTLWRDTLNRISELENKVKELEAKK